MEPTEKPNAGGAGEPAATQTAADAAPAPRKGLDAAAPAAPLVGRLLRLLGERGVRYCHWKSNHALDRSLSGENDLDLLVARSSVDAFTAALHECGFKQARLPPRWELPGVLDYFGFDEQVDRLVHVHAHHRLIVGHDSSKNYHLPIEDQYVESARPGESLLPTPLPEFELVVFVLRMMLKHRTWEAGLAGSHGLTPSEEAELEHLSARADGVVVDELLRLHLPSLSPPLFRECLQRLRAGVPFAERVLLGRRFLHGLDANARRPRAADVSLTVGRRLYWAVRSRAGGQDPKRKPVSGGTIVAVVGGDGAGKTTAVEALCRWLSPVFATRTVHLGKPTWSLMTVLVRGLLKAGRLARLSVRTPPAGPEESLSTTSPLDYTRLLGHVLTARDRYLAYRGARRFAANGGLVVTDRYPMRGIALMDAPPDMTAYRAAGGVYARLVERMEDYYDRILPPDLLVVLRVDPSVAVRRKTDEDPESVRARSTEIWQKDWSDSKARLIDAGRTEAEVLLDLKREVWSVL